MNMHYIDWVIVAGLVTLIAAVAIATKKLTRSVADFLAAGRCAGRYIICISDGIAGLGAVSFLAMFEMYYHAGFSTTWWAKMTLPVYTIIAISGWVIYRYRQTRAMTMGQFFEMRYNKNFRIFAGVLGFLSGIINFGIFPAIGARFFIYYCGLPAVINLWGLDVSTFPIIIAILLTISLIFVYMGGQVTVIVTDFIQGILCMLLFVVVLVVLFQIFSWPQIITALESAPEKSSMLHPFRMSEEKDFNVWYWLIAVFSLFYTHLAWQGQQAYNCSAKSPHEAKMGRILGSWRGFAQVLLTIMLPICAFAFLNHPDFAEKSVEAKEILSGIENEHIRKQMTVPVAIGRFLPIGIMGSFCAVMLAAFISTHDTYLHSWGSIFIQDVIMPFRKKPFEPKQHIRLLRWSILGVAVFIYCFSLIFRQTQYILMFFAITGAIYLSGAGAAIIGGLYWKRGTTSGAWVAMIAGSTLAVSGIIAKQINPDFPINGQWMMLIASLISIILYICISLVDRRPPHNMDKLFHRGKYFIKEGNETVESKPLRGLKALGISKDFTRGDKIIYIATIAWTLLWFAIFVFGTIYNLISDVNTALWAGFWRFYVYVFLILGTAITIWFTFGGIKDIKDLFHRLKTMERNDMDDGMVINNDDISRLKD